MNPIRLSLCVASLCGLMVGCKPDDDSSTASTPANQQEPQKQPIPNQVAKVGVGAKGGFADDLSDNNPTKIVAGPAAAFFRAKEKIAFEIAIPQQVNLFRALHDRYPKSHDEYMKEIIDAARIKLPALPTGMVYRYHPESHELWVESEANPQGPTAPLDD